LFADPHYRWASLATLVLGIAFGLMFLAFYLLFTGVWDYSQAAAGFAATPGPLLAALTAVGLSSHFSHRGFHLPMLLGGLAFTVSNAWLAFAVEAESAYFATWLPAQVLGGIAIGLMLPSITAAAVSHLPLQQLGVGSAANSALRLLGSSLGVALAVALVGSGSSGIEPFRLIYWGLAVCGLIIAAISRRLRPRSHEADSDTSFSPIPGVFNSR
jgi:MFS family permease